MGWAMWSLVMSTGVGLVFMFFIKEDLRRRKADNKDNLLG